MWWVRFLQQLFCLWHKIKPRHSEERRQERTPHRLPTAQAFSLAGAVKKWHRIWSVEVLQPKELAGLSKLPSQRGASASSPPGTGTCALPPSLHCVAERRGHFWNPRLMLGQRANGMRDESRERAFPVGRVKLNTRPFWRRSWEAEWSL